MTAGPRHWRIDHPTPKPGGYTVADLLGIVLDMPYELVDGEIVLRAPTTQWHDEAMILLREGFAPVPDVLAIDRAKVQAASLTFSPGDARLVVEVVSPGTRTKDRKHRPMDYAGSVSPTSGWWSTRTTPCGTASASKSPSRWTRRSPECPGDSRAASLVLTG